MDLSQREADYKRLNEELEAKTASLFQETESMLRQQEQYLAAAADLESQGPGYYIDRTTPSGPARPDYFVDSRLDGVNDDDDVKDLGFSHTLGRMNLTPLHLNTKPKALCRLLITDNAAPDVHQFAFSIRKLQSFSRFPVPDG